MLKEYVNVRQIPGEPSRRWFHDDYFDLIAWLAPNGEVGRFQLCYDKHGRERVLDWHGSGTCVHSGIDNGEGRPLRHKSSPVTVTAGSYDSGELGTRFLAASGQLPEQIRMVVMEAIEKGGSTGRTPCPADETRAVDVTATDRGEQADD